MRENRNMGTFKTDIPGGGRNFALRCAAFAGGVVINSFGIAFITKAALGTSPISSHRMC